MSLHVFTPCFSKVCCAISSFVPNPFDTVEFQMIQKIDFVVHSLTWMNTIKGLDRTGQI